MAINFDRRESVMHSRVASMRFPGPDYYQVLEWLHEDLRPESYLEIGVFQGESLKLALPPAIAVGIDPFPEVNHRWRAETHILVMSSNEFFAKHTLREFFGKDVFAFAFVDGLHRFEQAIEDIFNLEAYALPESVVAVHDTIPLDEKTAARDRRAVFHTGDVWKVVPFLKSYRPDLELVTVRTGPSGLTLIRGLGQSGRTTGNELEAIRQFQGLPWDYYKQHRDEFLETIPNERDAVVNWLSHQSHDQHRHSGV